MLLATPDAPPWNERIFGGGHPKPVRTSYEIDRDRIIHSETFRDLQYKTQVQSLTGLSADRRFRTRLNHVIEVAQLARGLSRELNANEALAEAIALAHDLGHPPFGHAGERALRQSLEELGEQGWNANVHSLGVVEVGEAMFISHRGLNLTWATREGIARHSTPFDEPVSFGEFAAAPQGGIECQIVDAADVLAYLSHDLDDALADDFVELADLAELSPTLEEAIASAEKKWENHQVVWQSEGRDHLIRRRVVAKLISLSIADYRSATTAALRARNLKTPDDIRSSTPRVVVQSQEFARLTKSLLDVLTRRYYRSDKVRTSDAQAEQTIRLLFAYYVDHPEEIPARFHINGKAVAVATYIASMNDRTATERAKDLGLLATA